LKGIIEEEKKNFWGHVAARMGKTARGCERSAKEGRFKFLLVRGLNHQIESLSKPESCGFP